jgi:ComF family protein
MSLIDFLFPRRCLGCGKFGNYFCQDCLKAIRPLEGQICPACEKPAFNGFTHPRCQTKYTLDGLVSIFPYEDMMKIALSKLKYKFITDLAKELVDSIIRIIELNLTDQFKSLKWLFMDHKSILVPIPLYWQRENWRGFNQSELLGKKIAKHFGWEMRTDVLIRQKSTQPQVGLKSDKRQENISGAFCLNSNWKLEIRNWKFIIFDDVWTTGSTLKEAARVLKIAGAKEVWGLTICR